jgi:hypothetical protein
VTNIRNTPSLRWRRWLGTESRCLVPFTSSSENEVLPDGSRPPIWFALGEDRPLVLRRHLEAPKVRPEGQGRRDRKRYLRVPDHGAEYADRHVSPQGHAGDPDDTGRH